MGQSIREYVESLGDEALKRFDAEVRQLALSLLDDDEGVPERGYDVLRGFLGGSPDILQAVEINEGRAYLSEDFQEIDFTLNAENLDWDEIRESLDREEFDNDETGRVCRYVTLCDEIQADRVAEEEVEKAKQHAQTLGLIVERYYAGIRVVETANWQ